MSAERRLTLGVSLLVGLVAGPAAAQENEPDMDFLEYLGTWDASDEDWLVIREFSPDMPAADAEAEPRPVAADEENTESKNES